MRRGWKIYPPFFVLIAATVLMALEGRVANPPGPARVRTGFPSELRAGHLEPHVDARGGGALLLAVAAGAGLDAPLEPGLADAAAVRSSHWRPEWPCSRSACRLLNWYVRPSYNSLTHLFRQSPPARLVVLRSRDFCTRITFTRRRFADLFTPRRWFLIARWSAPPGTGVCLSTRDDAVHLTRSGSRSSMSAAA